MRAVRFRLAIVLFIAALFAGGSAGSAQTPGMAPDVEVAGERMLFTRGPDGPLVLHMVHIVNVGPRRAELIPLPLPEGAVMLDVPPELEMEAGFAVESEPMEAGEARQYVFTYELPWQRLPMPIRRPLFYPTAALELWAEESLLLRGVGLREVGKEDIAGRRFTVYASTDLAPHAQWQVLLETTTGPAASVSERDRLGQRSDPVEIVRANPLAAGLLLAAVIVVIGAVIARRRGARVDAVQADSPLPTSGGDGLREERPHRGGKAAAVARLKEQIVQVDVAYQNDELAQDVYVERRAALRQELMTLLGRGGEAGGDADNATTVETGEEAR